MRRIAAVLVVLTLALSGLLAFRLHAQEAQLRAPFLFYAGTLAIATVIAVVFLSPARVAAREAAVAASEPVTESGSDEVPGERPGGWAELRHALGNRAYRAALAGNFTVGWAVVGVRVALVPLMVVEVLGRSGSFGGVALAVFAAHEYAERLRALGLTREDALELARRAFD